MTFSSPVAPAEFSKFAGILSAAFSQYHLSGLVYSIKTSESLDDIFEVCFYCCCLVAVSNSFATPGVVSLHKIFFIELCILLFL